MLLLDDEGAQMTDEETGLPLWYDEEGTVMFGERCPVGPRPTLPVMPQDEAGGSEEDASEERAPVVPVQIP
jgi:hypothetical protein